MNLTQMREDTDKLISEWVVPVIILSGANTYNNAGLETVTYTSEGGFLPVDVVWEETEGKSLEKPVGEFQSYQAKMYVAYDETIEVNYRVVANGITYNVIAIENDKDKKVVYLAQAL